MRLNLTNPFRRSPGNTATSFRSLFCLPSNNNKVVPLHVKVPGNESSETNLKVEAKKPEEDIEGTTVVIPSPSSPNNPSVASTRVSETRDTIPQPLLDPPSPLSPSVITPTKTTVENQTDESVQTESPQSSPSPSSLLLTPTPTEIASPSRLPIHFSAAGCLFQNSTHVLCGYQRSKDGITGIGGKRKGNENVLETAFRETLEELFNHNSVPSDLVNICIETLVPQRLVHMGRGYFNVILSLDDQLPLLLDICKRYTNFESNVYPNGTLPLTITELMFQRNTDSTTNTSEVESFCLLPIIRNRKGLKNPLITNQFIRDMQKVIQTETVTGTRSTSRLLDL